MRLPEFTWRGGAFDVRVLKDVVSTLSIQNKAKVVLITDACRSGKLSGSNIGGAQATAANLSSMFANEIKILSCQPDEYSIEGEQWGGGRGAFSYHLIDGLTGMADGDEDYEVNLKEIGRCLEDQVTEEVAPQSQNPMVVGNKTEKLSDVFPEILAQIKEGKKGQLELFTATDSRGIEDDVLAAADSSIVEMYMAFKESLSDKSFLCDSTTDNCTESYYAVLSEESQLTKLHSTMRRNYAAALQDDAQQVMNQLLKSDPWEVNKSLESKDKNYGQYPVLLRRAAQLLGEEHYMYDILMARSYWFEGYIKDDSNCACKNVPNARKIIPYYKKALQLQPDMPHAHLQLAALYGVQMYLPDSAEYYADQALKSVPNWTVAYDWVANSYLSIANFWFFCPPDVKNDYMARAKRWLERGIASDSSSILLLNDLGWWYSLKGEFANEQAAYDRALAIDTTATTLDYKAIGYYWWGKYEEAEKAWLAAVKIQPEAIFTNSLVQLYYLTGKDQKAKKILREVLASDYKIAISYERMAQNVNVLYPEEGIELYKKSIELGSLSAKGYNGLAHSYGYLQPRNFAKYFEYESKAAELDPKNHLFHNCLGLYYLSQQEWEKSKQKFLDARSLNSTHPRPNSGLYLLYTTMGQPDKAKKELDAGMKLDANQMLLKIETMVSYCIPESLDKGQFFQPIEKAYPNNPFVAYYHARYLAYSLKDIEGAYQQLEKALQLGYDQYTNIMMETRLRNLHTDKKRWRALINKYFPEQYRE